MMPRFKNRENERVVLPDGRWIFLSRSCAVVGMLICHWRGRDFVLLGKRGPGCPDEIGKSGLQCGYLDWDETLPDAARREIWEEAGIDLLAGDWGFTGTEQPWWVKADPEIRPQNVSHYYTWELTVPDEEELPAPSSENSEPGEVDELAWIPVETATNMKLSFDHQDIIGRYYEQRDWRDDLDVIHESLGSTYEVLMDGLPDGSNPEWRYDERLICDIARACREWKERKGL